MKKPKIKTVFRVMAKACKTLFLTSSFLVLLWMAYCLSLITADWLDWDPDEDYPEARVILVRC